MYRPLSRTPRQYVPRTLRARPLTFCALGEMLGVTLALASLAAATVLCLPIRLRIHLRTGHRRSRIE